MAGSGRHARRGCGRRLTRRVRQGTRRGRDGRGAARRVGRRRQRRGSLRGHVLVAHMARVGGRRVGAGGRGGIVASGRRSRVLVHGRLHLGQDAIDVLQISLSAEVRHGRQGVVLVMRVGTSAVQGEGVRCLGHIFGAKSSAVNAHGSGNRQDGGLDLMVRSRIDVASLNVAKQTVQVFVVVAAASLEASSLMTHVVVARTHVRLGISVDGSRVVARRGLLRMVIASLSILMRLAVVAQVSTSCLSVVIIIAGS